MTRRRLSAVTIERTDVVVLASVVERCTAELTRCIYASTCARRLAPVSPVARPRDFTRDPAFDPREVRCFMRAADHRRRA
jgi:hypothetical protein